MTASPKGQPVPSKQVRVWKPAKMAQYNNLRQDGNNAVDVTVYLVLMLPKFINRSFGTIHRQRKTSTVEQPNPYLVYLVRIRHAVCPRVTHFHQESDLWKQK
jgi:hypothetical protein